MNRKSVNANTALLVAASLLLSILLFQFYGSKTAYGSMSVTGWVLDNVPAPGQGSAGGASASKQPRTPLVANGSTFTYQGRLLDGGNPANGSYDFQFSLYD